MRGDRGTDEETPESDTPISEDQRELLENILKLRDKNVADVMVPRVDIVAIAADTPLDEVVRLIQAEALRAIRSIANRSSM